jgi:hypothetical protein
MPRTSRRQLLRSILLTTSVVVATTAIAACSTHAPDAAPKLAGSNEQTVLPFSGLQWPDGVAADGAGNMYVVDDSGFGQVVKLAADA